MTPDLNTERTVALNRDTKWIPIDENTPRGVKLQLINKRFGVAHYAVLLRNDDFFTHWFPLPTFDKDENDHRTKAARDAATAKRAQRKNPP